MSGPELVAHFLTLAQQLPASAWEPHPNPLLRWDILRLVVGAYRVEVVHQRYGDYWRVQVFPAQASSTSLLLLSAEGPVLGMRLTVMQPGSWPCGRSWPRCRLPVRQERRRYGWAV